MKPNLNQMKSPAPPTAVSILVLALLVALAGNTCADETTPPDTTSSFLAMPSALEEKRSDRWKMFSGQLVGIVTKGSKDINTGYGIGVAASYDGYLPLVPTLGFDLLVSSTTIDGLTGKDLLTFSPYFDLTLHAKVGRFRPFAGGGVNLYFNTLYLDEPYEPDVIYDERTPAAVLHMGRGIAPHVRAGLIVSVSRKLGIILQGRFGWTSETAELKCINYFTGEESVCPLTYDLPEIWFSVGVISGPDWRR